MVEGSGPVMIDTLSRKPDLDISEKEISRRPDDRPPAHIKV
jgi:hypothetical protein